MQLLKTISSRLKLDTVNINKKIVDDSKYKAYWEPARSIFPACMEDTRSYVKIDEELYAKSMYLGVPHGLINGYPFHLSTRAIDDLLGLSAMGVMIELSLTLIPSEPAPAINMVQKAINKLRVSQSKTKEKNEGRSLNAMNVEMGILDRYLEHLQKGEDVMLHTVYIITLKAKDKDILNTACGLVETVLYRHVIRFKYPLGRMRDVFLAAQPTYEIFQPAFVEMFASSAAKLLPITRHPHSISSEQGMYFGIDKKTKKEIVIDLKQLAARHMLVVGSTGSGKTTAINTWLMRLYSITDTRVVYLSPKWDNKTSTAAVADFFNMTSSVINLGRGGRTINPMEIMWDPKTSSDHVSAYHNHLNLLVKFFTLLFKEETTSNMENYLVETIVRAWREKGIVIENPETWKNATWPTLHDIRDIWIEGTKNDDIMVAKTAHALMAKSIMVDYQWDYMNNQSDVTFDADYTVIDLSGISNNPHDALKEAMYFYLTCVLGMRFRKSTDSKEADEQKETLIVADDCAVLLRNPQITTTLLDTILLGRSSGVSLCLATQQPTDLAKAGIADEIFTNTFIKIVLGNKIDEASIGIIKRFFNFPDSVCKDLMSSGVGEGVIQISSPYSETIPIKVELTDLEGEVILGKKPLKEPLSASGFTSGFKVVHESLNTLAAEHGIYMKDWIQGDPRILAKFGYEPHVAQRPMSNGSQNAWIRSDLFNEDGTVKPHQSVDHFATVMQIAYELIKRGITPVINHSDDVDIWFEVNGMRVALEYEAGSHTKDELVSKKRFAEEKYDKVYFICSNDCLEAMTEAVGIDATVTRGNNLLKLIEAILNHKTT